VIALSHDLQLCADLAAPTHAVRAGGILIELKHRKHLGHSLGSGKAVVRC
jgi:hypothetical protein